MSITIPLAVSHLREFLKAHGVKQQDILMDNLRIVEAAASGPAQRVALEDVYAGQITAQLIGAHMTDIQLADACTAGRRIAKMMVQARRVTDHVYMSGTGRASMTREPADDSA